jgi:hypothetical protein
MFNGNVRIINTGRRNILISPRKPAAIKAVGRESTLIPGINIEESNIATVITSQRIIIKKSVIVQ